MNNKNIFVMRPVPAIKLALLVFALFLLVSLVRPKHIFALNLNPDPIGSMPSGQYDALKNCDTDSVNPRHDSPAFVSWVSKKGAPTVAPSFNVTVNTPYVDMQLNFAGAVCFNNTNGARQTYNYLWDSPTPGVSFPNGHAFTQHLDFRFPQSRTAGTYAGIISMPFRYTPPGGSFAASGVIPVTVNERTINIFPGVDKCVPSAVIVPDTSASSFAQCSDTPQSASLQVTLIDQTPSIRANSVCSTKTIHVQVDDPDGSPSSLFWSFTSANDTRPNFAIIPNRTTYSIDMSAYTDGNPHNVWIYTTGHDPTGSIGTRVNNNQYPLVYRCPGSPGVNISCSITPGFIEEGVATPVSVIIKNNGATINLSNNYVNVTLKTVGGPTFFPAANETFSGSPSPPVRFAAGATLTTNTFTVTAGPANAGNFAATVNIGAPINGTAPGCNGTVPNGSVGFKPYVRIYGGNTFAGADTSCTQWGTPNPNAGIYGFTNSSSPNLGSAAQLALGALGIINGFSSAANRTTAPQPPNGLDFANTVSPPGQVGLGNCPYDFWGNQPANIGPAHVVGGVLDVNAQTSNASDNFSVLANSSVTLRASGGVGSSACGTTTVVTVYVNGNVVIDNHPPTSPGIQYACPGSWGNKDDVPRLQVVATGDIYIDQAITQLDGIYISQRGTIYTCASGGSSVVASQLYSQCRSQLTINGGLMANRIKWGRTYGTVADSQADEQPYGASHNCVSSGGSKPTCAAEVVNYSPEEYLVQPNVSQPVVNTQFNFMASLPPLL